MATPGGEATQSPKAGYDGGRAVYPLRHSDGVSNSRRPLCVSRGASRGSAAHDSHRPDRNTTGTMSIAIGDILVERGGGERLEAPDSTGGDQVFAVPCGLGLHEFQ